MQATRKAAEVSSQMLTYLGQSQVGQETLNLAEICRQSLALLNQVQFLEAQRVLAQAVLAVAGDDASRLDHLQLALCGRPATAQEQTLLRTALTEQRSVYAADAALAASLVKSGEQPVTESVAPAELAAWTAVAQLVMNSDGFVWKR